MSYNVKQEDDKYYIVWGNGDIDKKAPYVRLRDRYDYEITLNYDDKSIYFYEDQWIGIIKALEMAISDKHKKKEARKDAYLAETMDDNVFFGIRVDLTRRQLIEVLTSCHMETESPGDYTHAIILYEGKRMRLARTDLMDDVCTMSCLNLTAEKWREHYLKLAQNSFGGRLRTSSGGGLENTVGSLAVIDRLTDG